MRNCAVAIGLEDWLKRRRRHPLSYPTTHSPRTHIDNTPPPPPPPTYQVVPLSSKSTASQSVQQRHASSLLAQLNKPWPHTQPPCAPPYRISLTTQVKTSKARPPTQHGPPSPTPTATTKNAQFIPKPAPALLQNATHSHTPPAFLRGIYMLICGEQVCTWSSSSWTAL